MLQIAFFILGIPFFFAGIATGLKYSLLSKTSLRNVSSASGVGFLLISSSRSSNVGQSRERRNSYSSNCSPCAAASNASTFA